LAATLLFLAPAAPAQDEPSKKEFSLPKSPVAAAYFLGRLSNKELIEAPRGEFVDVALLQRKGLERKYRVEALNGLAGLRRTDPLAELIRGIGEIDRKGEDYQPVIADLAPILFQNKPADLGAKRSDLEKLADESQLPISRQIAWAGLVTADQSPDKAWARAEPGQAKLADLVLSISLLRDPGLRAAFYPRVEPLLRQDSALDARRAAITAVADIPGHDLETFNTLAAFVKSGTERPAAVAGLQRVPRKSWPKEQAPGLLDSLVAYLQSVPVEQRTEPDAVGAFQFANDLVALLPDDLAKAAGKKLRALGVSIFTIRTIREQMLYDKTLLVVEPGKPVQITLVNEDAMPHNIAIVSPGALEEIGQASEKMPPEPDAEGRLYVPNSPKVLHASKMADPGQQLRLSFTAPDEPGDYEYVCTFPGHWRRMTGVLAVTKDLEAYLASRAAAPQPKMTEWKIADFQAEIAGAGTGRNLLNGKDSFTKLGCAQCHKIGGEGINYGPDLADVFARYKNDRAGVLRQILEPSLVISNRYVNYEFETKDGDSVLGMILKESPESVTIQSGPSDSAVQTLKISDIKERKAQTNSPMPIGLLNALTKDQIFDLLAYLEAGGAIKPHEHHP
jgi:putative heme-binding domain-containing protein